MLKHLFSLFVIGVFLCALTACQQNKVKNTIRVGTVAGPETRLLEVAGDVALKQYGLRVNIIPFSDYHDLNKALVDGRLDANLFQHVPYLQTRIQARGYKIVSIGKAFLYPMGLYSKTLKKLSQLPSRAEVVIPNDPANEARALLLLQKAGLIRLQTGVSTTATLKDITYNPKHLKIVAVEALKLPLALNQVSLAAINTNYAVSAGLSPSKDALFIEGSDSPYAEVIVAREDSKNDPQLQQFVAAFQSEPVLLEAKKLFGGDAIPAWDTKSKAMAH